MNWDSYINNLLVLILVLCQIILSRIFQAIFTKYGVLLNYIHHDAIPCVSWYYFQDIPEVPIYIHFRVICYCNRLSYSFRKYKTCFSLVIIYMVISTLSWYPLTYVIYNLFVLVFIDKRGQLLITCYNLLLVI